MNSDSERLQTEFYHSVLRLHVIQCAKRAQQREVTGQTGAREISGTSRTPWQIFLDCLCKLCDAENGGATTTSIAVEQVGSRNIFWIAMNEQPASKVPFAASTSDIRGARDLIHDTLRALAGLQMNPESANANQNKIFLDSVRFCKKKIAHYRKYILKFVKSIQQSTQDVPDLRQLIEQIADLFQDDKNDQTVCKDAYDFCRSETGVLLHNDATRSSIAWRHLRHNIGRLACWYKATKYLVHGASEFADMLADFSVDIVPQSQTQSGQVTFKGTITDLFPSTNTMGYDLSLGRLRTVFGISAMDQAAADLVTFVDRPRRLKIHAEVRIADFFYNSGRSYSRNDRYLGCSKGSCYCCDLYLSLHPGNLVRRPCHGNAWPKWQLSGVMLTRNAGLTLLERMLSRMEYDIRRAVMDEGQRKHVKTFDSSTGVVSFERV